LIKLTINNRPVEAEDGTTVAAAVCTLGIDVFRQSVTGEARGPLCGMGICFECRVTIDGVKHERSCNTLVRDGMEIVTDA
jgi:predicted molibdopterin-dependent oxidoreductase YjgC